MFVTLAILPLLVTLLAVALLAPLTAWLYTPAASAAEDDTVGLAAWDEVLADIELAEIEHEWTVIYQAERATSRGQAWPLHPKLAIAVGVRKAPKRAAKQRTHTSVEWREAG